jgi:aspartyl-tRNA(Asn)/glutamyl-tRNA(Gln) amidotransferase subunit C
MTQIDDTLLQKLEKLSSLEIEESKRQSTIQEISKIVDFVENLSQLDLNDKDASFSTIEGGTPFREDVPACDPKIIQTILENAPKSSDGFFIVPKIIE